MRDLKFATVFPSHHPRKGESTNFVEKIWQAISENEADKRRLIREGRLNAGDFQRPFIESFASKEWTPKRTTIRAGHRWKKGDMFIPKIWTGLPYRSKPIAICEPLEVLEVEDFEIRQGDEGGYFLNNIELTHEERKEIALIDGFDDPGDFELWFIDCWKKGQTVDGQRIRFA